MEQKLLLLRKEEKQDLVKHGLLKLERYGGKYGVSLRQSVAYQCRGLYDQAVEKYKDDDFMLSLAIDDIYREKIVANRDSYQIVCFNVYRDLI